MKTIVVTTGFLLSFMAGVLAQEADRGTLEITGQLLPAGRMTREEIARLPVVEQDVRYQTSKGEEAGRYKGPLLWSVLEARGITELSGHNPQLRHSLAVEGRDGYRIVISVGEVDPDFGNAPIQLGIERDGEEIVETEGYRLVVPGDKRGARYVRDVVKIEIR